MTVEHSALAAGDRHLLRTARACGVLYIIDQLCEMGGAERVMRRMLDALPRQSFDPTVLTFRIDPSLRFDTLLQCAVHVFPLTRTYDASAVRVARQIRQLIRSQNIKIVHTFHETADLWGGMVAKLSGCPVLISSRRDMGFQRQRKHRIGYRWFGRYFDEVQVVSEEVRRFCIQHDGLDPKRVVTVYNGIDVPPRPDRGCTHSVRRRFSLPTQVPLVLSVGHIRRIKGFDVYMRAAARVITQMPDVMFAVAGCDHDPAYTRELSALSARLGLGSKFVFLGDVEDISSLLSAADVFCLPSRSEGMSNALLEAMASELPCVASRVGGNPEAVIHGETGFLFENEDYESAANRIVHLLRDTSAARIMGAAGRQVVMDKFTTEVMMERLVDSYERLLSAHVPRV